MSDGTQWASTSPKPAYWSGYHDSDCVFGRTNVAYGDPTADATCTLTAYQNNGFTVTSYLSGSDKLPGLVITPPRASCYLVSVQFGDFQATGAAIIGIRLTDGTTSIGAITHTNAATTDQWLALTGIYCFASTSPQTLRLQTKSSAGAVNIQSTTTVAGDETIQWTIVEIR
jgi:hypothetical protein